MLIVLVVIAAVVVLAVALSAGGGWGERSVVRRTIIHRPTRPSRRVYDEPPL